MTVDASNNIIVTGITLSADFPTLNVYNTYGESSDGFLTKFTPTGQKKNHQVMKMTSNT
jgi:hypothetical protein